MPARAARPETERFATLHAARRTWAVAAIHGEAERLAALHGRLIERLAVGENLVYLGNYLGRGPAVAATVDELLRFRIRHLARRGADPGDVVFLRGGQEEMWHKLLQIHLAPNPAEVLAWMERQGIAATLAAYGGSVADGLAAARGTVALAQWTGRLRDAMRRADGHVQFMSALKHAAFTEDGALLFVHAGLDSSQPLAMQADSFWWGAREFDRITDRYSGCRRVVRGFDPRHQGIVIKEATASIDGGCGFGGPLVAACFDPEGEPVETIEA